MEAIEELQKDPVICAALGSYCVEKLVEAKTAEWDSYRMSVTQWELGSVSGGLLIRTEPGLREFNWISRTI